MSEKLVFFLTIVCVAVTFVWMFEFGYLPNAHFSLDNITIKLSFTFEQLSPFLGRIMHTTTSKKCDLVCIINCVNYILFSYICSYFDHTDSTMQCVLVASYCSTSFCQDCLSSCRRLKPPHSPQAK